MKFKTHSVAAFFSLVFFSCLYTFVSACFKEQKQARKEKKKTRKDRLHCHRTPSKSTGKMCVYIKFIYFFKNASHTIKSLSEFTHKLSLSPARAHSHAHKHKHMHKKFKFNETARITPDIRGTNESECVSKQNSECALAHDKHEGKLNDYS